VFLICVPDLLVIYLLYFGGSTALGTVGGIFGVQGFIEISPFLTGALAIGVISGAYQGVVYRGAFHAIGKGEIEAGRSVGMGRLLLFRRIIAPQVLRFAIPGLGNCWQLALKETALISVIGLVELLRQASVGAGSTLQPFYFYTTAAALYLVLTGLSAVGFERAEVAVTRGMRRA
jgi:octopine/nopaline transport system permease protein